MDHGDPAVAALITSQPACRAAIEVVCSGTLIAPRVVLTAAHCRLPASDMQVFFGDAVGGPGVVVDVQEVLVHPEYDHATKNNDVGLVLLAEPVAAVPVPPRRQPLALGDEGMSARIVGFGADEDGALGIKRHGTASVTEVRALDFELGPDPAMTCGGDSGGPVLVNGEVAGVTSRGDEACLASAVNMRVDAYFESFIDPGVAALEAIPPARRPGAAAGGDNCTRRCQSDEACPRGMTCDGERCTLRGATGEFGAVCHSGADCTSGQCAGADLFDDRLCRCFVECDDAGPAGCSAGRASGLAPVLAFLLLLASCRRGPGVPRTGPARRPS